MNIFVLDKNIKKCAQYHCDQHVPKMILESVQMLCTSLNKQGFQTPYKSTHIKHPCVFWVEESYSNFLWLKQLAIELNKEFIYRYDKDRDHASIKVLTEIETYIFTDKGLTEFAQAMPDNYKFKNNAVRAYRNFYRGEKARFAKWTKRPIPKWMIT
ncbi:MAG: pyrimidine dimer DNA glycosylase/endonuclease V [Gammaproteobacteria bacterium]|nr:pyrimidine dimer DNA glycosylase/endonuclease V [Gammaproteobacteria bacterium]